MSRFSMSDVPLGSDPHSVRKRVEALELVLERAFTIPGTNRKVGLDVLLDIVPGIGGVAGAALGSYMVWEARNLRLPKTAVARMMGNVGIDFLLGLIPWIGAVPDFFFRSNSRNLRIIKRHLDRHHPGTGLVEATARPVEP
jgi:hypothetical protein